MIGLASAASAEIVINQPFTSTPPSLVWTPVTSNGGSINFAGSNLDVSGFVPTNSAQAINAYEQTTTSDTMQYTTSGGVSTGTLVSTWDTTFNTTNSAGSVGGEDQPTMFNIYGGGNQPIASFYVWTSGWFGRPIYEIGASSQIEYAVLPSTVTGVNYDQLVSGSNIDGHSFQIQVTTTITNSGTDPSNPSYNLWTLDNTVTMDDLNDPANSYTFIYDRTGDADSGYDPLDSPLVFQLGNVNFGAGLPAADAISGDEDFTNFSVTNPLPAPEPASLGLLAIGSVMGLTRRRRSA
jgi:hypothetical protein